MSQAKRFVFWRRSIDELTPINGYHPINTLEQKIKEATKLVQTDQFDEVIILEIKKVVSKVPQPVRVRNF